MSAIEISRFILLAMSAAGIVILFAVGYKSKKWGYAILPLTFLSGMFIFYALRLSEASILAAQDIQLFNNIATALHYMAIITVVTLGVALLWNRG